MIDLPPLLRTGTVRERALLQAGADEAPNAASMYAAARAAGLVPKAAFSAYLLALVLKGLKSGTFFATLFSAPVLAVSVVGVAVTLAVFRIPAPLVASPPLPLAAAVSSGARAIAPVVPSPVVPSPVLDPAPSAPPRAKPPAARAQWAPVTSHAASAQTARDALGSSAAQLTLIERARQLADTGDAAGSLAALAEYDRQFPHGGLHEEAQSLRIQAVAARGDRAAAAVLARRFLVEHPRSVHANKVGGFVMTSTD